jgi:hypothetical protein
MLSTLIASAGANPRTTLAGLAGFISLLAGAVGTSTSGRWWPVLVGLVVSQFAQAAGHAMAADARKDPS